MVRLDHATTDCSLRWPNEIALIGYFDLFLLVYWLKDLNRWINKIVKVFSRSWSNNFSYLDSAILNIFGGGICFFAFVILIISCILCPTNRRPTTRASWLLVTGAHERLVLLAIFQNLIVVYAFIFRYL